MKNLKAFAPGRNQFRMQWQSSKAGRRHLWMKTAEKQHPVGRNWAKDV